jgi:ElaB/YqjD/DUF883 family membrane-anchored ribosome-binding protein
MENNAGGSESGGGYGNSGDLTGSAGYGASGVSGSSFGGSSSTGETGGVTDRARDLAGNAKDKLADSARDLAGNAKDKLADVGSSVREGASNAKNKLADALEAGADRLRHRGGHGELSGSSAGGTADVSISSDGTSEVSNRVAGGLKASADWLRQADVDTLRMGVERQVKEHPGRTLLVALGLGYLLGRAVRR